MENSEIKRATLGRLPLYLEYIRSLPETQKNVSSAEMAKDLKLGEVQVRKDLSSIGKKGLPKIGFNRIDLQSSLKDLLKEKDTVTVLVGAGKIGRAILDYEGFKKFGLSIKVAFDNDKNRIGTSEGGKEILSITELKDYCKNNRVEIGIITVPYMYAQSVCDLLIESGVKVIWNFAPTKLEVPEGVTLQQEDMSLSLAYLNYKMHL